MALLSPNSVSLAIHRQYVVWLNNESLEHGGQLVEPWPLQYVGTVIMLTSIYATVALRKREIFSYYANQLWEEVRRSYTYIGPKVH